MSDFNSKYRPQKISELDLASVRTGLEQLLKSGKVPQALLFTGSRGTGKTSAARILAKAVNCLNQKKDDFEPCNQCEQCLSITRGSNLDVLEIDAASNRGIEDIRDLREKIKLAPISSRYKVYIIDEVHMLTTEAFNALLKTLEEPPAHAVFILCTTDPEKLPETIVSRCLRFNFKRGTQTELVEKMKKIVEQEGIKIDEMGLAQIAKSARGSFRDSQKILEQVSFLKEEVTREKVEEILGQTSGFEVRKLIEILDKKDIKAGLDEIARVNALGVNFRVYLQVLLEYLRELMLSKLGVVQDDFEDESGKLHLEMVDYKKLIEIFTRASLELKDAVIPQLPPELAVVEWCMGQSKIENVKSKIDSTEIGNEKVKMGSDEDRDLRFEIKREKRDQVEKRDLRDKLENEEESEREQVIDFEEILSRWPEVVKTVRAKNYSLEALLRATRPKEVKAKFLILEVFYKFHKDKLETDKCRITLEQAVKEIYHLPLSVKCVLGERPQAKKSNNDSAGNIETEDDIIKAAEEIFGEEKEVEENV